VNTIASSRVLAAATLAAGLLACGGDDLVLPSEGEPARIEIIQGDGQSGRVGETLPQPLIVQVTDGAGRPTAGATVVVALDGAEARPDTVSTESDGRASVEVVLGPEVGPAPGEARVMTPENQQPIEVAFTVNAVAASANGLALESGNGQTAPAGAALAEPLVVRVTDAFGNPFPGVAISWTPVGGGSVSETSTTTGQDGRSAVTRTLGSASGEQSTQAASEGLAGSPAVFTHTATAGSPSGVSIVSGNRQTGDPGTLLPQPLVVQVADAAGNPVAGAAVAWIITGGGGSLDPQTSTTDASGRASSSWTLGSSAGPNTAEAVVSGVGQVTFEASAASPGPDDIRIVSGDRQTGQAGQQLGAPLVVQVVDASDAPVAGVEVTWRVRSGGGSVAPSTGTTDAGGQTTAQVTLGSGTGENRIEASVPGAGSVTFTATAAAGAPAELEVRTQPSASAQLGQPFGRQPEVQLSDAAGNEVRQSGVVVTAGIASGPGSLGGTLAQATDGNGRARFTDLRIDGAAGTHTLSFSAPGLAAVTSEGIEVAAPNAPPTGVGESYTTPAGDTRTLTISATDGVLANDTDPDGDALTAVLETGPANGTLTLAPDGGFTYTPNPDYLGPSDSFTYRATDGSASSEPTAVSITVLPPAPSP
jgi:adhesin/invasin